LLPADRNKRAHCASYKAYRRSERSVRRHRQRREEKWVGFLIIIVGGILGWLASIVMRTDGQQGILLNIVVGIVGAIVGGLLIAPLIGGASITTAPSTSSRCSCRSSARSSCSRSSTSSAAVRCADRIAPLAKRAARTRVRAVFSYSSSKLTERLTDTDCSPGSIAVDAWDATTPLIRSIGIGMIEPASLIDSDPADLLPVARA
jgi:uncharacterized membrane protein YeaQ/YmgE (transglycosylase-associated protein family)